MDMAARKNDHLRLDAGARGALADDGGCCRGRAPSPGSGEKPLPAEHAGPLPGRFSIRRPSRDHSCSRSRTVSRIHDNSADEASPHTHTNGPVLRVALDREPLPMRGFRCFLRAVALLRLT